MMRGRVGVSYWQIKGRWGGDRVEDVGIFTHDTLKFALIYDFEI